MVSFLIKDLLLNVNSRKLPKILMPNPGGL